MNNYIPNKGSMKKTKFRSHQNKILKNKIINLKGVKTVLNTGSFPLETDKSGVFYKDYFLNHHYYTLDKNKGNLGNNHFNMDLCDLSLVKKSFDLVLCMSVLEHVKNPFMAAKQLKTISNKYLFITVPFIFPFHQKYKKGLMDYWRFTDEGLRELFSDFDEVWIEKIDSVIKEVKDKKKHWNQENSKAGYISLFKRKI